MLPVLPSIKYIPDEKVLKWDLPSGEKSVEAVKKGYKIVLITSESFKKHPYTYWYIYNLAKGMIDLIAPSYLMDSWYISNYRWAEQGWIHCAFKLK